MDLTVKLSPHFTLGEFVESETATINRIHEQYKPPKNIVDNLTYTASYLLEPIRKLLGNKPMTFSSGWRCFRLNVLVKGKWNSQHMTGQAVDINRGTKAKNKELFNLIKNSGIVYDQLINEYNFSWVHISVKPTGNRMQTVNVTK